SRTVLAYSRLLRRWTIIGPGSGLPPMVSMSLAIQSTRSLRSASLGRFLTGAGGIRLPLSMVETLSQNSSLVAMRLRASVSSLKLSMMSPLGWAPAWHPVQYLLKTGAISLSNLGWGALAAGSAEGSEVAAKAQTMAPSTRVVVSANNPALRFITTSRNRGLSRPVLSEPLQQFGTMNNDGFS